MFLECVVEEMIYQCSFAVTKSYNNAVVWCAYVVLARYGKCCAWTRLVQRGTPVNKLTLKAPRKNNNSIDVQPENVHRHRLPCANVL
jgi:hypothetical protein